MLKAFIESAPAKAFGTINNSALGPSVIVKHDPPVTGFGLASVWKEVNIGWSGYIPATVYP